MKILVKTFKGENEIAFSVFNSKEQKSIELDMPFIPRVGDGFAIESDNDSEISGLYGKTGIAPYFIVKAVHHHLYNDGYVGTVVYVQNDDPESGEDWEDEPVKK